MPHAGFWIRLRAALIDGAILLVAQALVTALLVPLLVRARVGEAGPLVLLLLALAVAALYESLFVSRRAATPGKLALGLRVLRPDGARLSRARAVGRFLAKLLSALPLCLGYLFIVFDHQKRGLHDMFCDTRVVLK